MHVAHWSLTRIYSRAYLYIICIQNTLTKKAWLFTAAGPTQRIKSHITYTMWLQFIRDMNYVPHVLCCPWSYEVKCRVMTWILITRLNEFAGCWNYHLMGWEI